MSNGRAQLTDVKCLLESLHEQANEMSVPFGAQASRIAIRTIIEAYELGVTRGRLEVKAEMHDVDTANVEPLK